MMYISYRQKSSMMVRYLGCLFATVVAGNLGCQAGSTAPYTDEPRERIVTHSGFDRNDVPNYTVHAIDPRRMVELRRTCVGLDSPGVDLKQVDSSFLFLASASHTPQAHFRLTSELTLVQTNDGPPLSDAPLDFAPSNDSDPTRTFGDLPGLFPISAAVSSPDGRYVYYSAHNEDEPVWFRRIVRFDRKTRKVTAEMRLSAIGCNEDVQSWTARVQYLFMDAQGRLIAFAGSDTHYMDHDHVRE